MEPGRPDDTGIRLFVVTLNYGSVDGGISTNRQGCTRMELCRWRGQTRDDVRGSSTIECISEKVGRNFRGQTRQATCFCRSICKVISNTIPGHCTDAAAFVGDSSGVPLGQYTTQVCISKHSFSRGYIHATSATDVNAAPDFDAGFLSNEADIAPHVSTYKKIREIARRMPSFRGELEATHPRFAKHSAAVCILSYDPDVADVQYSEEDDKAIEIWVRERIETCWHSSYARFMDKSD